MASERIINEYDSTRIANAVDTLATNLADYSGTTVTPTDAMKAKLPSQTTADRIADAVETLAQNVTSLSDLVRASYEESPAIYAHAIDDILYYNNKFYDVTSAIAIGDTLTVSSGLIEGNISERAGDMSYEVFGIPGGGSDGTVIADDVYNALIHAKQDGTGEEVANNKTGGDGSLYAPVTSIATPENGGTASKAYAVGEMFIRGGKLCTCIVAISAGDTLIKDTNYKEGDVGSVLTELNSKIVSDFSSTYNSDYILGSDDPLCVVCKKHGVKEVQLRFTLKNDISIPVNAVLFSIGEDYIPDVITSKMTYAYFQIGSGTSEKIFPIAIRNDGKIVSTKAMSPSSGSHLYNQGTFVYM